MSRSLWVALGVALGVSLPIGLLSYEAVSPQTAAAVTSDSVSQPFSSVQLERMRGYIPPDRGIPRRLQGGGTR